MSFWDFLRPVTQIAWDLNLVAESLAAILAVLIFSIALLAFKRKQSKRLLFVSLAFMLFALKWVLKIADQFISPGFFFSRASEAILELVILALLFYAIFRK